MSVPYPDTQPQPFPQIPDQIPIVEQDFALMRCLICADVVPGMWGISRRGNSHGLDHLLETHLDALLDGSLRMPPFMNCAIQDPFWFEEHAHA